MDNQFDAWANLGKTIEQGWLGLAGSAQAFLSNDFVRLIISATLGSALSYAVMIVRIDERQVVNTKAIADLRVDLEALRVRAEKNATALAKQDATDEIRTKYMAEQHSDIYRLLEKMSSELREKEKGNARRVPQ